MHDFLHFISTPIENACIQAKAQIFIQPDLQIGLSLGLIKPVQYAHFAFIMGAAADTFGCHLAQLTVGRIAIA